MATMVETEVQGPGNALRPASDGDLADPVVLAMALVAALKQALVIAHHLVVVLDRSPGLYGEVVAHPEAVGAAPPAICTPIGGLSPREAQVLGLLAAGMSNRQIAAALGLSPRTVQRHVANLYLKIGVHNRAEATVFALHHHLA